jgi:hypothetical protein
MKIIYRISSSINRKNRPDFFSKEKCFINFIKVFGCDNVTIIADNITEECKIFLSGFSVSVMYTSLGNSQSFLFAMNYALSNFREDDAVYFLEDDYLHLPSSSYILEEGLTISDYVTGYDHPDKYINGGPNPYISEGGEQTRVLLTKSSHWKLTNSTTMTFLVKIKTLREDRDIIEQHCKGSMPGDFAMFCKLIQNKSRKLVSPLPGISTHMETEHLTPLIAWNDVR